MVLYLEIQRADGETDRQTDTSRLFFLSDTENIIKREYNKYGQSKYKSNIEARSRNHC